MNKELGIYIHFPFCIKKCPYCDFYSKKLDKDFCFEEIVFAYIKELKYFSKICQDKTVKSIFFGGGTPSLLPAWAIEKIINEINKNYKTENLEISIEANPKSLKKQDYKKLKISGINRFSLGVQSLNDENLSFLGRAHNKKDAMIAIEETLKNFDNSSCDLIYSLPHQKTKDLEKELKEVFSLGFNHYSLYQLSIEPNTPFYQTIKNPINEDIALEQYQLTKKLSKEHNIFAYEISNYAKENYQCWHNNNYWQGGEYLGIGASAHSRIEIKNKLYALEQKKSYKYWFENVEKYNYGKPLKTLLTKQEGAIEKIIMGLRTKKGVLLSNDVKKIINESKTKELSDKNFISIRNNYLVVCEKGEPLLNSIIEEVIL